MSILEPDILQQIIFSFAANILSTQSLSKDYETFDLITFLSLPES
jgi:hypothetical protein